MVRVVQKFGGTSVATLERVKNVANIIAGSHRRGQSVVAVVSAMAGVTNKFVGYVRNLNTYEGDPEYDYVVSSGELITAGLVAIALKNLGLKARSYSSWQVPIFTSDDYGHAVIQRIDPTNLQKEMEAGVIPVICGFQGVSSENRTTTLGRGGSDLTAVAVAAAVQADLCEIYSDVDGVYTVDPNLYHEAKRIDEINYYEMLEMASQGAKILQEQSVDYAIKKNVVIRVASSFIDNGGTIISGKISPKSFRGLAIIPSLSQIRVLPKGSVENILELLRINYIRAESLKRDEGEKIDIILDRKKSSIAINLLKNCDFVKCVRQVVSRKPSSRISVIGASISSEIAKELANVLRSEKIEVFETAAGGCRVDLTITSNKLLESIAILHRHCGLEK
ncbi:MAG: aspartate kinase [Holosporaceae bacterium]|nr:aspartate kinase [Holosporaceae bacterium]